MVEIVTNLRNLRENARTERVEQNAGITATTVQGALEQLSTGKLPNVGTARLPASATTVSITTADIEVGITTTSTSVGCPLPSVAAWASANQSGLELTIFDYSGNAATNNITPSLNGSDAFLQGQTPVISVNYGQIKLRPMLPSGSTTNYWFVRAEN